MLDRILAHRRRFPTIVNRAIDYVADHPMSFLGRLAARRMGRPDPRRPPAVSSVPDHAPIRVLIAPVNYAGQARAWSAALERADPRIAARNMAVDVPGGFAFQADLVVPVPDYVNSTSWQQAQFAAASSFSHVLIEAEEPLFGRLLGRDVAREAAALAGRGIDVAFIAHGTDLRRPSRHADATPWSPYRDATVYVERLERLARRNYELLAHADRPIFVSTPDLLSDAPSGAVWCPVVVDPARWSAHTRRPDGMPLRVVHAPTSTLMKGTPLIEPVLHRLHDQGVIDYRPVIGVPSARMPEVYAESDVVLDQFRLGSYGVAACEAMAGGRIVVGHVTADVRASISRTTGRELPIVEATPDDLEGVLTGLAADTGERELRANAGRAYVADVHDGRASAAALIDGWIRRPAGGIG